MPYRFRSKSGTSRKAGCWKPPGLNARVLVDFMPEFGWVLGELALSCNSGPMKPRTAFTWSSSDLSRKSPRTSAGAVYRRHSMGGSRYAQSAALLMSEERCRLLLIVAYRDNEVDPGHPAMITLRKQVKSLPVTASTLDRIVLGPPGEPD